MAQEVKYLSYSGLSHLKDILEGRYEKKGHTHTVANITDFGSHVYGATISRTKNTVLAAPNGSNGTASFRALVAADLPTHTHSYLPLAGGVLSIAASTETFNSITTNNDNTSWNVRPGLKIANNNNALVFWTSGVTNERTAYIQSGHKEQAYATALGPLHLNPFGGKVIFGKSVEILHGVVKATSFTGNLTGNVTGHLNGTVSMTSGNANAYRNILVTNGSNGICYSSLNNVQLNYATGDVKATSFTGNLTGNVTGNVSGSSGSCTGNAATATKASTVTIAANSADVACELWFQDSSRDGNRGKLTYDNDLRYNPSKNTLMIGGMTSSVTTPTTANVVLDGTNKKLSLGESYIQYNSSTGCLEIIA